VTGMNSFILSLLVSLQPPGIHLYGDSIFTTSFNQFGKELGRLTGEKIVDHAAQGARMGQIEQQYLRAHPPFGAVVVFDGGGNDVLGNAWSCRYEPKDHCKELAERAAATVKRMLDRMKEEGVRQVIFVGPHYPSKGNSGYEQIINYTYPLLKDTCSDQENCSLVDTREIFQGRDDLLEWDGIHPTWQGANLLAEMVTRALD